MAEDDGIKKLTASLAGGLQMGVESESNQGGIEASPTAWVAVRQGREGWLDGLTGFRGTDRPDLVLRRTDLIDLAWPVWTEDSKAERDIVSSLFRGV